MTKSSLWGYKVIRKQPRLGRHAQQAAFSLVEVVIAMAIFSFAIVTIAGLFVVGLTTNKESSDQIQAANVASLLISTRRALPTSTQMANLALPPLNVPLSAVGTYLTNLGGVNLDGTTNSGTTSNTPAYNLYYQVGTNSVTGTHLSQVHMILWWPITAAMPTNNPSARYELNTEVALP